VQVLSLSSLLKNQSASTGTICQGAYASMVGVSRTVKNDVGNVLLFGSLCQSFAGSESQIDLWHCLFRGIISFDPAVSQGKDSYASGVVNQLGINVLAAAKDRQTWSLGSTTDFGSHSGATTISSDGFIDWSVHGVSLN